MLEPEYDVVVVGSGYGGGIAASRLSRAGLRVCVLERGREFLPHEFPEDAGDALEGVQMRGLVKEGSPLGLFDVRLHEDLCVVIGCGLGGTSLINANVSIRPEPRIFDDAAWPKALRDDRAGLDAGFERARAMLRPRPYPAPGGDYTNLTKLTTLEKSAKKLSARFSRTEINVTFENGPNHVGTMQTRCTNCGNCCSGCRERAKNTTATNYLPDAKNHGAHIFSQIEVLRVERNTGTGAPWTVVYRPVPGHVIEDPAPSFLRAHHVVLAAGALGSTEILLRSAQHGLSVSSRLGQRFSGNGDVLAFAYNCDEPVVSMGFAGAGRNPDPVGPTITGVVDLRDSARPLDDGMIIEDGAIPGALGQLLPEAFATAARIDGEDTDAGFWDATKERLREIQSITLGPNTGAVKNSQVYLLMSHDGSDGQLVLENGSVAVRWPGYPDKPVFGRAHTALRDATAALGGTYVANPVSRNWLGGKIADRLVTVHPLGGSALGDDANTGVVDHRCRVFDPSRGPSAVHAGLYVADGAVIPRSVGVNPLYTICAVAERAMDHLVRDLGKTITYEFPVEPGAPAPTEQIADSGPLGFVFTETMAGHGVRVAPGEPLPEYTAAQKTGAARGDASAMSLRVTITLDDLESFIADPKHLGSLAGVVRVPLLHPEPLSISRGDFNLFIDDPAHPGIKNMLYNMVVSTIDGHDYFWSGHKVIRDDPGIDVWSDTTTLYVDIHEGRDVKGPIVVRGVTQIGVKALADQVRTYTAVRAKNLGDKLRAQALFMQFSMGTIFKTYGPLA
jgi:cholesterol oxidase